MRSCCQCSRVLQIILVRYEPGAPITLEVCQGMHHIFQLDVRPTSRQELHGYLIHRYDVIASYRARLDRPRCSIGPPPRSRPGSCQRRNVRYGPALYSRISLALFAASVQSRVDAWHKSLAILVSSPVGASLAASCEGRAHG